MKEGERKTVRFNTKGVTLPTFAGTQKDRSIQALSTFVTKLE